jgi:hypothetical protein
MIIDLVQRIKEDLTELLMAPILMEEIIIIEDKDMLDSIYIDVCEFDFVDFAIIRIYIGDENHFNLRFNFRKRVVYYDYNHMFKAIREFVERGMIGG